MSLTVFLLVPVLILLLDVVAVTLLLKRVFKVPNFSVLTVIGILLLGGLLSGFVDVAWWSGYAVYFAIIGFALFKKFQLSLSQIAMTLAVLTAINVGGGYVALTLFR